MTINKEASIDYRLWRLCIRSEYAADLDLLVDVITIDKLNQLHIENPSVDLLRKLSEETRQQVRNALGLTATSQM